MKKIFVLIFLFLIFAIKVYSAVNYSYKPVAPYTGINNTYTQPMYEEDEGFYQYQLYNPKTNKTYKTEMKYITVSTLYPDLYLISLYYNDKPLCVIHESKTYKKDGLMQGKCLDKETFFKTFTFSSENQNDWYSWKEYQPNTYYREVNTIASETEGKTWWKDSSVLWWFHYKLYDAEDNQSFVSEISTISTEDSSFDVALRTENKFCRILHNTINEKNGLVNGKCINIPDKKQYTWSEYEANTFNREIKWLEKDMGKKFTSIPIEKIKI